MIETLLTARAIYGVRSPGELEVRQRQMIAKMWRHGIQIAQSTRATPCHAYVDAGRWLVDCECGSGVGIDPRWPEARCLGCGAVIPVSLIQFPEDQARAHIEAILTKRPHLGTRNWQPGETVESLRAENLAHGVE